MTLKQIKANDIMYMEIKIDESHFVGKHLLGNEMGSIMGCHLVYRKVMVMKLYMITPTPKIIMYQVQYHIQLL